MGIFSFPRGKYSLLVSAKLLNPEVTNLPKAVPAAGVPTSNGTSSVREFSVSDWLVFPLALWFLAN